MKLLMLQHHPAEHAGEFRRLLTEDGHTWDTVHLDAGDALPSLDGYDGLWVLGGPMDVWQEDQHPWFCLLYTSPSPRDLSTSRMPSSA